MKKETITITKAEYEAFKAMEINYIHLERQMEYLLEQMRLARHKQFGASSEKSIYDPDQLQLFNEAELFSSPEEREPELQVVEQHVRRKRRELPQTLPENLPVEVIEHVLPEEEQVCSVCEEALQVIGKEVVRRELKLIPASAVIVEHVRTAYACRHCEKTEASVPVHKAPVSRPVIAGSFATPEAIALIAAQKFVMAVPLYRQEQEWKRLGIELSRQTMSNWLLKATEDWLKPLYEAMRKQLLQGEVLHADETSLQVLKEPGKAAQSQSTMWLYRSSSDAEHPLVLYEYQPNRKAEHPKRFLEGWRGYLHTDGYAGYHSLSSEITVVGCWAHARRGFDEALKAIPEKERPRSGALEGKTFCDRLFALERELKDLPAEERYQQRQERAEPVLDAFLTWLRTMKGRTGKNALGKAVRYTLDQWPWLAHYLLDGRLELSNNRAERSIKPFVIGRKNFLFANTPKGAQSSAILYSLIETAKENQLKPYDYLVFLLRELPNVSFSQLIDFVPGGSRVPPSCITPTKV